jgi:hypothetical protein
MLEEKADWPRIVLMQRKRGRKAEDDMLQVLRLGTHQTNQDGWMKAFTSGTFNLD